MRQRLSIHWLTGLGLLVGMLALVPASAQMRPGRETQLGGVTLGSTFVEVLRDLGMPAMIGPALGSADDISEYLNPVKPQASVAMAAPAAAPMGPVGPGMASGMGSGATAPKPQPEYTIFLYRNRGGAIWNHYVFFNRGGYVVSIVATVASPGKQAPARAATNVGFAQRLTEVVRAYDWPEPFAKVGSNYFCNYPDRNIAFSLDTGTRTVIGIAVGVPMTVLPSENSKTGTGGGGGNPMMGAPGTLPGSALMPR